MRQLIQLMISVIEDFKYFSIFLFAWLLLFSIVFQISGLRFTNDEDYLNLNVFVKFFIQTYRNSIGDILAPSYQIWIDLYDSGE